MDFLQNTIKIPVTILNHFPLVYYYYYHQKVISFNMVILRKIPSVSQIIDPICILSTLN